MKQHAFNWLHAAVVFSAMWMAAAAPAQPLRPVALVRNVTDTYFGTAITDPYRHFENKDDSVVARWMKAHSDYATHIMSFIPGRRTLLNQIARYDSAVSDRVAHVTRVSSDLYFIERRSASENQFKLYMRRGLQGRDTLLVDPEAIEKKTGKPHAINWFVPSPDGQLLAYGLSAQGSEAAVMYLLDTRSGKHMGPPIDRADFGGVEWSPDSRHLVFNRLQALRPGAPATDKYQNSQTYCLQAGQAAAAARKVFGAGVTGVDITAAEIPTVALSHDGHWALGYATNGTQRELGLFVAPQASLLTGQPRWRRVLSASDEVTSAAYFNDTLYLVSHRNAPRSKVMALSLKSADETPEVVMPTSELVLVNVVAAADAIYIEARDGNIKRLFKRAHDSKAAPVEVPLPLAGSFELVDSDNGASAANPRVPGVLLSLQNWNRAQQIYAVAANGSVVNTGLQPAGAFDAPVGIVTTETRVPAPEGVLVPMSIIHRADMALDGNNPTILYGYASYGATEEPYYSVSRLAWLEAGGVFAVANPRGSGVYGESWYRGGFQASKPNSWKDFIACAEYLIHQKYTQPSKLGIWGGSAGGILVGRAMTERPDLFAAVVSSVGVLDTLRMESTPNGVPNIPEFGSVKTEAGFKALLAMSTYDHIVPGTAYPAVMFTHGVNDPRVEVWNSTKTAARLMAATSSGKPVLLRLAYDAGHGIGNTKRQALQERADVFSFFLWQMGAPSYQP